MNDYPDPDLRLWRAILLCVAVGLLVWAVVAALLLSLWG